MAQTREKWLRSQKVKILDLFLGDLTSQWGKKFFLHFSTEFEKKNNFFFEKNRFLKKRFFEKAQIFDLKWPLKAQDDFSSTWCQ